MPAAEWSEKTAQEDKHHILLTQELI